MAVQPDRATPTPTTPPEPGIRDAAPRQLRAPGPARRTVRLASRLSTAGVPLLGVLSMIGIWWGAVAFFHIHSFLLPSPLQIVTESVKMPGYLLEQARATLTETLEGFAVAVVGGLLTAALLASSRTIERAVMPMIVAVNAIPKLAVAPLLVVWLGFGQMPKVVMVVLVCSFPIVVAAMAGLTSTPAELGELATSLTASRWQTFAKIRIPWALPQIFVGLKVSVSLSVIGAVVAEFSGADTGLGKTITEASSQGETALAFAAIVLLAMMSISLFYVMVALERVLLPWVRETSA
jgi:NitT/TauT family transport system permease protein